MNEPQADLAIVVVNFGDPDLLRENLVPLARATPDAHIVVVDNRTTDAHRSALLDLAAAEGWDTVLPESNTGFGGGMNRGVERAANRGATRYLLLNPDASLERESLDTLSAANRREPLTLLTPRILRPDGSIWFDGSDLYLEDGRIRSHRRHVEGASAPWLTGACVMISSTLWDLVGGFDEEFFLYWEDVDLSWRVVEAGGSLAVLEEATATHAQGGTQAAHGAGSTGQAKSDTYYFYNIRNRLLFGARHLDSASLRRWVGLTPRIAREILLQGGRRQFLTRPSILLTALRGVREGRRIAHAELHRRARDASPDDRQQPGRSPVDHLRD